MKFTTSSIALALGVVAAPAFAGGLSMPVADPVAPAAPVAVAPVAVAPSAARRRPALFNAGSIRRRAAESSMRGAFLKTAYHRGCRSGRPSRGAAMTRW